MVVNEDGLSGRGMNDATKSSSERPVAIRSNDAIREYAGGDRQTESGRENDLLTTCAVRE